MSLLPVLVAIAVAASAPTRLGRAPRARIVALGPKRPTAGVASASSASTRLGCAPRTQIVALVPSGNGGPAVGRFGPAADAERIEREVYLHPEDMPYREGSRPESALALGLANFRRQGRTILEQAGSTLTSNALGRPDPDAFTRLPDCLGLTLSNSEVAEAERRREAAGSGIPAHPFARVLYDVGCAFLDGFFDGRPIARFWFLETIARVPYFAYVSMLHLYETIGWWRAPGLRQVHAAEEWNELHHLLIMEALGGDARWSDRFLGYHAAVLYYWLLVPTYLVSPAVAYEFMELLEAHAVDTYSTFVRLNRKALGQLPPPSVAVSYYTDGELYLFDDFQQRPPGSRRPPCASLLDVFVNICEDEGEHVKTMRACQDYAQLGTIVTSPHLPPPRGQAGAYPSAGGRGGGGGVGGASVQQPAPSAAELAVADERRAAWARWSEQVNSEMKDGGADPLGLST